MNKIWYRVQPVCIYIDQTIRMCMGKTTYFFLVYLFIVLFFVFGSFLFLLRFMIFNYLQNSEEEGGWGGEMQPT